MSVLAAVRREKKKIKMQLVKLQRQLNGLETAAKALGDSADKEMKVAKKRILSAAGRAAIIKAVSYTHLDVYKRQP